MPPSVRRFALTILAFLPLIAAIAQTEDDRVWTALQEGGKVILLRHAHVDIREGIGRLSPGNCAEEVNLSTRGIEQAKRIGEAFRTHGIAIQEVLASPYCRSLDTGKIAFGRAVPTAYLMPTGVVSDKQAASDGDQMLRRILSQRGRSNLVMITQDMNIANIILEPAEMGELFVLEPKGADFTVIGKIQF